VDLDSRILAPAEKLNQNLTSGPAAVAAVKAKHQFVDQGRIKGLVMNSGAHTIVAVEPVILYSPQEGKNIPVAMGVIALDASIAVQGPGEVMVLMSESLIWLSAFALIIAMIVYRLTLKPLQILHDEVDRSLKGEVLTLTRDIKFAELGQLLDGVETALQRAARATQSDGGPSGDSTGMGALSTDDLVCSFKVLGDASSSAVAFCDSDLRPVYLNGVFEEVTGIRHSPGEAGTLASLARDQAFGSLLSDLFDRSPGVPDGVADEFEFSGVAFAVQMVCLGGAANRCKGYVFVARRKEGG
jgi:hypothetical protein